jgi:hypothetical protein
LTDINKERRWARIRRQRLTRDLSNHFRDRVLVQIDDALDTARIARIPSEVKLGMIINNLLRITALIAIKSGASKADFVGICGEMFDQAINDKKKIGRHPIKMTAGSLLALRVGKR